MPTGVEPIQHLSDGVIDLADRAEVPVQMSQSRGLEGLRLEQRPLAGVEAMATADGMDVSHLLRGESGAVHKLGVTEFAWSKSVRKGNYRFVYYPQEMFADAYPDGFGELYDLEADPWEMRNLFFDSAYADTVCELRNALLEWLVTTTRPATIHPPPTAENAQATLHYENAVNADGKIHPDNVRAVSGTNYV